MSERPLATRSTPFSFYHLISLLASTLTLPLDSTTGARQPRTNHFPSHSHSLPLSCFYLISFPFSLYFRQRRSILSRSSTALVRSRTFLYTFLFIFADISFIFPSTIFLNVRHNDYVYLPIPDADPLTNEYDYQSVGTHVFKLPPRRGRH